MKAVIFQKTLDGGFSKVLRMEKHCNTTRFLGYDKDEHGELVINEKEAEIVRRIYQEYIEGKSYNAIAKGLMKDGIRTVTGNE